MPDNFKDGKRQPDMLGITNAQLLTRVKALETWKTTATADSSKLKTDLTALTARVVALEAKPSGTDYSAQIAALTTRMNAIEAKVCPQESRIVALEADHIPD